MNKKGNVIFSILYYYTVLFTDISVNHKSFQFSCKRGFEATDKPTNQQLQLHLARHLTLQLILHVNNLVRKVSRMLNMRKAINKGILVTHKLSSH